jgi:hypothetical protein
MPSKRLKAIYLKPDGVYICVKYINGKRNPYREIKSESLSEAYAKKGLDIETVKLIYYGFCRIIGKHPSVTLFLPCVEKIDSILNDARMSVYEKYTELELSCEMFDLPKGKQSAEVKSFKAFQKMTIKRAFERIAALAEPLTATIPTQPINPKPSGKTSLLGDLRDKQDQVKAQPVQESGKGHKKVTEIE